MGRSISFEYEKAIDRATRLFWRDGYFGASLRNLLKAMQIGEGSFYNTIKSKKRLYIECLKHYGATEGKKRTDALLSAPTASLGLRAMMRVMLDCLDDSKTPSHICMFAAMISEDVMMEPELKKFVIRGVTQTQELILEKLEADKKAGRLPAAFDSRTVAPIILTYFQGIWRMSMISYDRRRLEREIEAFLRGLGLAEVPLKVKATRSKQRF